MSNDPDPTKDPEFQKVIRHFVTTPPQPHTKIKPKTKTKKQKPTFSSSKKVSSSGA